MTIDWINFTPWTSLAGGVMIGLAAVLLLIFSGRIAGISGILGGLLPPEKGDLSWRLALPTAPIETSASAQPSLSPLRLLMFEEGRKALPSSAGIG